LIDDEDDKIEWMMLILFVALSLSKKKEERKEKEARENKSALKTAFWSF
jgi:hypothetical protein